MGIEAIRRQSIISFIWQIALTFVGFLSTIYFAQTIGANVLGAFYLFIAYLNIFDIFTNGGFGGAAVKRISEGEHQNEYFTAVFVLRALFVTIVISMLILFHSYFIDLNTAGTFNWLLIALIVSFLQGTVSSGIAGCGKIGIQSTAILIDNISRVIIQVCAIYLGYEVAGLAGGFVIGAIIGAAVQIPFLDLRFSFFGWKHLKSLASFSFWSFLVSSGGLIFLYADSIMIGYFMNNADVGIYRVILQFTAFAAFTTTALRGTLWPRISRWDKIGEKELIEDSLTRAFSYSFLLALPLFVGGALIGDKLLYFFYGADFVSYSTLMILFTVQIINIFHYFFTTYLSAMNRIKDVFKVTVVAVASNIVLNAALIPYMGISGAAFATLITITLNAILIRRVLAGMITIKVDYSSLLNILVASIIMGVVVGIYRLIVPLTNLWSVLIAVFVGGVVYGILIMNFDEKISKDIRGILVQMNIL